jgi:hypothetical protein
MTPDLKTIDLETLLFVGSLAIAAIGVIGYMALVCAVGRGEQW